MHSCRVSIFCVFVSIILFSPPLLSKPSVPDGFVVAEVAGEIDAATALTVSPDGRVFIAEQTGKIRIVENDVLLKPAAIDLADRLDTWWERGLLGMALHPDFPASPFLYVVYVAKEPHSHHVISRFTIAGNEIDADNELVLLRGENQADYKASRKGGHQGGPIVFGADGMLYIGLGELTAKKPSRTLDTIYGKILRLSPDGSIPQDNPFYDTAEGNGRATYATGIRNPFGMAVDPATGALYETEVGASSFEEINLIEKGKNYGWPSVEGRSDNPSFANPIHAYPPAIGRSVCGAMFYPESGNFPSEWKGKLFIVDWAANWVRAIDPKAPEKLIPFGTGFDSPVGLASAPDGSVYVLNRNTIWERWKKTQT